jgi:hypothetical protein
MTENLPKVYWTPKPTDPKGPNKSGTIKELSPSHQAELEALLRIGWTTEKPA